MRGIVVSVADDYEAPPSDIVLKIDFREGGSAARVFDLAADLIRSLEDMDQVLIRSINSKIETTLIVEDLQKSSIKVFLRNVLTGIDDEALKKAEIRPIIGSFLVQGKYAIVRWLDRKIDGGGPPAIDDLTEEIAGLARASDVLQLPAYPPPNPADLILAMDRFQDVKKGFGAGEGLTITLGPEEYAVDVESVWKPSDHIGAPEDERTETRTREALLKIVSAQFAEGYLWRFTDGTNVFTASMEDRAFLDRLDRSEAVLSKDDTLKCVIEETQKLAGNRLKTDARIIEVKEHISGARQLRLF